VTAWPEVALQDVAILERDAVAPDAIEDGTTYVGLEHITTGGDFVNVGTVEGGDLKSTKFAFSPVHVLYGKLRPYLGKIARPDFSGVCTTEIIPIRPGRKLDRSFLVHFLRQPEQIELATARSAGANLPRLSPNELAKFKIPLPPVSEQRRIAAILDQADVLRAKRRAALAQLDEMAQALFVEMFGIDGRQAPGTVVTTLAEVVRTGTIVTYGIVQAGDEFPGGVPYIRTGDIVNGEIRLEGLRHTDPALAAKFARSRVVEGEIVMSIRATVGTAAMVPRDLEGANLTQGTARIVACPCWVIRVKF
jgi:type I restriction enzyme S subunit